jgi:cysteine synthase A
VTVATDGHEMYRSEMEKFVERDHNGEFDALDAAGAHARFLEGADTEHVLELGEVGRRRIFNLGYYTWVEQQGVEFDDFESRRDQSFWQGLHPWTKQRDTMIDDFSD